ncbi:hypothetical protein EON63_20735 [archaeon]|nr:MAG: hypothetical protein EON63_20735 [archaeon]
MTPSTRTLVTTPIYVMWRSCRRTRWYDNGVCHAMNTIHHTPYTIYNTYIHTYHSPSQEQLEADCYWCFTKFLDTIQDHYIHHQPGIQRCVVKLEDLVARLDPILYKHMKETHEVQFIQFAFRWCNCLLIREFPINCIVR